MVGCRAVWVYTFLYQNLVIIYVSDIVLTYLQALLTCNSFSRISRPWWQILGIPSVAHAVLHHLLLLKWVFLCLCSFLCHFQAVLWCKQYLLLLSLWRQVRSVTISFKCFKKHRTSTGIQMGKIIQERDISFTIMFTVQCTENYVIHGLS